MCYGEEVAPTTGHKHLQGYVYFKHEKTRSAVKAFFHPASPNVRPADGSAEQNRTYCFKLNDPVPTPDELCHEFGTVPKKGKRSDLDTIRDSLEAGASIVDVMSTAKSYQGCLFAEKWLKYKGKKRPLAPVTIYWLWGPPESGKTRWVYDNYPDVFRPLSYKWWEGYDGESEVLLDDIRGDFCKFHELLKLTDRYPFRVEVKCGSRQALYTTLIITCPDHPRELYSQSDENIQQLLRRITEIKHFPGIEPEVIAPPFVFPGSVLGVDLDPLPAFHYPLDDFDEELGI